MSKLSQAKSLGRTAEQLTFFAAGFPANPPASPESEKAQMTIAGSGLTSCAWCLKLIPCGCWRRILAECLLSTLAECNSANGLRTSLQLEVTNSCPSSWLLKTLVRHTEESAFSSWPTATAMDGREISEARPPEKMIRSDGRNVLRTPGLAETILRDVNYPKWKQELWMTPRANKIGGYSSENWRPTLEQQVNRWPTPTTAPQGGRQKAREAKQLRKDGSLKMAGRDLATEVQVNGQPDPDSPNTNGNSRAQLNYRWVAQLQGFPSDWLDGIE